MKINWTKIKDTANYLGNTLNGERTFFAQYEKTIRGYGFYITFETTNAKAVVYGRGGLPKEVR